MALHQLDPRLPVLLTAILSEEFSADQVVTLLSQTTGWKPSQADIRAVLTELGALQSAEKMPPSATDSVQEAMNDVRLKMQKIILIYQNEAMGISVHCVVYEGESISRFICHSGGGSSPRKPHFPFFQTGSVHRVFSLTFRCFLRGWISSNNPGCAIPDGVKSASMTPAFI